MITNGKIQLYPFLRLAVMLILGIVVGKGLYPLAEWWMWCCACVITLVSSIFIHHKIAQTLSLFIAVFLYGAMVTGHKMAEMDIPLPDGKTEYQAIVMSQPTEKGKVVKCDLLVTEGMGEHCAPIKATVLKDTLTRRYTRLSVGDGIIAYGTLTQPQAYHPENHFDYPLWLRAHGYVAQSFIAHDDWARAPVSVARVSTWQRLQLKAVTLRERVLRELREYGLKGQEMAVIAAMTLGDKSMINPDTRDAYSATGVSHVLALSGLHLGIIFQVIILLTGRRQRQPLNTVISLLAIWAYAVLVGLSASVIRSAVMISVYAFVSLLRRNAMSVNSLSLAACVMLVSNPLYLYDISFQLSFMAVLSILVFQPMLYGRVPALWLQRHRVIRWVWSLFTVSLAAQIGTQPLVTYYFGQIACYSLLANFVAVPAATAILYLSAVTLITYPLGFLCQWMCLALAWMAQALNHALTRIALMPGAVIDGITLSGAQLALLYVAIAALTLCYSKMSSTMKSSTKAVESLAHGS